MSHLVPFLPIAADETLMSWATRLAALHTGESLVPFLNDIGLPLDDLDKATDAAIDLLAERTGHDPAQLVRNAMRTLEWRRYMLRGEIFMAEFLRGSDTGFCPACLLEDDARGNSRLHRRGRLLWLLRPIRVCPDHELPLIDRPKTDWLDRARQMALIVPETGAQLEALRDSLQARKPAMLQRYVIDRLEGRTGPDWLDGQRIDQAARATEMLGVILAFGTKPNLDLLSPKDWDEAAEAGFPFVARGEMGIREALGLVEERSRSPGKLSRKAGPQQRFGRLYQWLQFSKNRKDPGPIRHAVREYILDTSEVAPGKPVCGEVVVTRRRHSIASLAAETKLHASTLRSLLVSHGLVDDTAARTGGTFDAVEANRIVQPVLQAIPIVRLPGYINASRGQVRQLISAGILPQIDLKLSAQHKYGAQVLAPDADAFLAKLRDRARDVDDVPEGWVSIDVAAQKTRVSTDGIYRMILEGKLKRVVRLRDVFGCYALHLDPAEIVTATTPDVPVKTLSLSAVSMSLDIPSPVILRLIDGAVGVTRLRVHEVSSTGQPRLSPVDVELFAKTYVSLRRLSRETQISRNTLVKKLSDQGCQPIVDPMELGVELYRRRDLPPGIYGLM
ncbi:TniQ family protein [Rhodobacter capsulatus]|nr:TniQ family protein [Rhodobacter capsulatus]